MSAHSIRRPSISELLRATSISIYDRDTGDGPAQVVFDKTTRARAKRLGDEVRDELNLIQQRVETTIGAFELDEKYFDENKSALFVPDLIELEKIIKDAIKKKKYQQEVVIFVVGYETKCGERLKLLAQVNDFFLSYVDKVDEDELSPTIEEVELEEVSVKVKEALQTADKATERLTEINTQMVAYVNAVTGGKGAGKSKKKLEKALQQAKDDIQSLTDKLMGAQAEIEEKEEQMTKLYKQIDIKTLEVDKFRKAADVAKAKLQQIDDLKNQLEIKDIHIKELNRKIEDLELTLEQLELSRETSQAKLRHAREENEATIQDLHQQLQVSQVAIEDLKLELQKDHQLTVKNLTESHEKEIQEIKETYETQIKELQEVNEVKQWASGSDDEDGEVFSQSQSRKSSAQSMTQPLSRRSSKLQSVGADKSKPSTPAALSSQNEHPPLTAGSRSSSAAKLPASAPAVSPSPASIPPKTPKVTFSAESVEKPLTPKPATPPTVPTPATPKRVSRSKSNLETVEEITFDENYRLEDEDAWDTLPKEKLRSGFREYRSEALLVIKSLQKDIDQVKEDNRSKITKVKEQFQEAQKQWDEEKNEFTEQIVDAQKLQTEAEKEAEDALNQLENFMVDQEKLQQDMQGKEQAAVVAERPEMHSVALSAMSTRPPESRLAESHSAGEQRPDTQQTRESSALATGHPSEPGSSRPISAASQHSSLVNKYRSQIEEKRSAMSERKSRAASKQSQKSARTVTSATLSAEIMGELEAAEKVDMATSPFVLSRLGSSPASAVTSKKSPVLTSDHPVVQDYFRTYSQVIEFKDNLVRLLSEKEFMSASEMLNSIPMVDLEETGGASLSQLSEMTNSVIQVLKEVTNIFTTINPYDMMTVSSLAVSQDQPAAAARASDQSPNLPRPPPNTAPSMVSAIQEEAEDSASTAKSSSAPPSPVKSAGMKSPVKGPTPGPGQAFFDLQADYDGFKENVEIQKKEYEKQLNHNAVVMMEMQDMIKELQRELSALGAGTGSALSGGAHPPTAGTTRGELASGSVPIMFTRTDLERNQRALKRAVNSKKISPDTYGQAVTAMDKYVDLPAKRLKHLAEKYKHHMDMKAVEERVRQSDSLDTNVFALLDKMEQLQNERAHRWGDKMDELVDQRLQLAELMMATLTAIEEESGIFLIKPVYSWQGRGYKATYEGPLSSNFRRPKMLGGVSVTELRGEGFFSGQTPVQSVPAPTPAGLHKALSQASEKQDYSREVTQAGPESGDQDEVAMHGTAVNHTVLPQPTWSMAASVNREAGGHSRRKKTRGSGLASTEITTPRILEMDITRAMFGNNLVSSAIKPLPASDDRLVNASNNSVRSYITLSRTPVLNSVASITTSLQPAPESNRELSKSVDGSQPLPPIGGSVASSRVSSGSDRKTLVVKAPPPSEAKDSSARGSYGTTTKLPPYSPPRSPPGSSIRQSPSTQGGGPDLGEAAPPANAPGHLTRIITRSLSQSTVHSLVEAET